MYGHTTAVITILGGILETRFTDVCSSVFYTIVQMKHVILSPEARRYDVSLVVRIPLV